MPAQLLKKQKTKYKTAGTGHICSKGTSDIRLKLQPLQEGIDVEFEVFPDEEFESDTVILGRQFLKQLEDFRIIPDRWLRFQGAKSIYGRTEEPEQYSVRALKRDLPDMTKYYATTPPEMKPFDIKNVVFGKHFTEMSANSQKRVVKLLERYKANMTGDI